MWENIKLELAPSLYGLQFDPQISSLTPHNYLQLLLFHYGRRLILFPEESDPERFWTRERGNTEARSRVLFSGHCEEGKGCTCNTAPKSLLCGKWPPQEKDLTSFALGGSQTKWTSPSWSPTISEGNINHMQIFTMSTFLRYPLSGSF